MPKTLQLKRTDKDINNEYIQNYTLEDGELFIVENAEVNPDDENDLISYLFVGDGSHSISALLGSKDFLRIRSRQIPDENSITNSMLKAKCVTQRNLDTNDDPNSATNGFIAVDDGGKFKIMDIQDYIDGSLAESIIVSGQNANLKMQFTRCQTSSGSNIKRVSVPGFKAAVVKDDDTSTYYLDMEYLDGSVLLVHFTNENTSDDPVLRLTVPFVIEGTDVSFTAPDAPIYFKDSPIAPPFNWRSGDFVQLVYSYENNRWTVLDSTAQSILGSWCYNNDTTVIDGGAIYTGSIDADKIKSHSISTEQLVVGAIDSSVFSNEVQLAINNIQTLKQQATSSRQVVCTCSSDESDATKTIYLEGEDALAVGVKKVGSGHTYSDFRIVPGTSLIVKFMNPCGSAEVSLRVMLDSFQYDDARPVVYYGTENPTEAMNVSNDTTGKFKWENAEEIRVLIYNGGQWEVQPTTADLLRAANYCLSNGISYIQGGNIITGRVIAEQIISGSLDVGTMALIATNPDTGAPCGSVNLFNGSTDPDGTNVTYGIQVKGSSDAFYMCCTNAGLNVVGSGGMFYTWTTSCGINGKSNPISIRTTGNIRIGAINESDNYATTSVQLSATAIYIRGTIHYVDSGGNDIVHLTAAQMKQMWDNYSSLDTRLTELQNYVQARI